MKKEKKITTVPNYNFEETGDENVQKVVDRDGNWTHYFLVKEKRYVKAVSHVLSLGYSKGPRFRDYLASHTKEEISKVLTEKGDEGSRSHMAIRDLIAGVKVTMETKYPTELFSRRMEPLNADEWENVEAWMTWAADYSPRVVAFEETVASNDYAGTIDALMVITVRAGDKTFPKALWGQDVLILIDWKTSSAIWSEYECQTSAYIMAALESRRFAEFFEAYKGRTFTGVLRVGSKHKCGYEFEAWDEEQWGGDNYFRFNAAMKIANRHEPDFDPTIEQIPTQFQIKVPRAKAPKPAPKKRAPRAKAPKPAPKKRAPRAKAPKPAPKKRAPRAKKLPITKAKKETQI